MNIEECTQGSVKILSHSTLNSMLIIIRYKEHVHYNVHITLVLQVFIFVPWTIKEHVAVTSERPKVSTFFMWPSNFVYIL